MKRENATMPLCFFDGRRTMPLSLSLCSSTVILPSIVSVSVFGVKWLTTTFCVVFSFLFFRCLLDATNVSSTAQSTSFLVCFCNVHLK